MARFKTEDDMLDAMPGGFSDGRGKPPRGASKAAKAAFVPQHFYHWPNCKCVGQPGGQGRADYFVHDIEKCPIHAGVKGNFDDEAGA